MASTLQQLRAHGSAALGQVTEAEVRGRGHLEFVYAADPEGNIIEIQRWS